MALWKKAEPPAKARVPKHGDVVSMPGEDARRTVNGIFVMELASPDQFRVRLDDGRRCTVVWLVPHGASEGRWFGKRVTPMDTNAQSST